MNELKNKNYEENFLKTLESILEENDLRFSSQVLKSKEGYLILWFDNKELKEISKMLEENGFVDLPDGVEARYADEVVLCEHCRRILELVPQHAFWQPDYIRTEDGYVCSDCIDLEELVEEYNNDFSRCIYSSCVPYEKMEEFGYKNYAMIMNQNNSFETKFILNECLEDAFIVAKNKYSLCVVYCLSSNPFEAELTIFVKE